MGNTSVRLINLVEYADRMEWLSGAAARELFEADLKGRAQEVADILDRIKRVAAECALYCRTVRGAK